MKISFDFNGVLDTEKGMELAKQKIDEGNIVYIITSLRPAENVKRLAKALGIPLFRVHFLSGADKWETVKKLGINIHYDNNAEQIEKINKNTEAKGILFTQ
jgi:hypothetical protein